MAYKKKSTKDIQKEVSELLDNGLAAIKQFSVSTEDRLELLNFMSDFHQYSIRNQSLILSQFDGAYAVGSFNFFKEKGFSVKKGEKGIRILRPNFVKLFKDQSGDIKLLKNATKQEKALIDNKQLNAWEMKQYAPTSVFDITQTNAEPEDYPKIFPNKRFDYHVDNPALLDRLEKGLLKVADQLEVPIHSEGESIFRQYELGAAKGSFIHDGKGHKEIVMNSRNTPSERVQVLIHELAHAKLHDSTQITEGYWSTQNILSGKASLKEFQAEMVSYVVSRRFGMDTSEHAIPYIGQWTNRLESLENESETAQFLLLDDVQRVSKEFIVTIDEPMELALAQEKKLQQEKVLAFKTKYELDIDIAFSQKDIRKLQEAAVEWTDNQVLAAIDLHRSEAIVEWAYSGSKPPDEIADYQEEQALNLRKKLMDGHYFYQVGESMEILLAPGKDNDGFDFFIMDKTGDVSTYPTATKDEAFSKLQEMRAFSVPGVGALKRLVSEDRSREHQKHLVHNQVMRNTYLDETGRDMT